MTVAQPTPLVETDFEHVVRQHRAILDTLADLREIHERGDDLAACHDNEREADGRPRRSRRHSA